MITGDSIVPGDVVIGLLSQGLHTNGYSLARKLLPNITEDLADELLKIHRSYLKPIRALHDAKLLKGAAHITGGGLTDNIPRILPDGCGVEIETKSWPGQPIFDLLQRLGNIPEDDFRRTFNLGIGMALVISAKKIGFVSQILKKLREPCYQIGRVVELTSKRQPKVKYL
jgi:phosphoribosylformylglycinamidine cyclo-ligase